MPTSQNKTEPPTTRRLRQAREQGNVPLSSQLTSAILLIVVFILLTYQLQTISQTYQSITLDTFKTALTQSLNNDSILTSIVTAAAAALDLLLPVISIIFVLAILIPFLQVGPIFTATPLKPKLSRINPFTGLIRNLFTSNTLVTLLVTLLKIIALAAILFFIVRDNLTNAVLLITHPTPFILQSVGRIIYTFILHTALLFLALAFIDFFYQRHKHRKDLRMSPEERKREYREHEGDPLAKAERKRIYEQFAVSNMLADLPSAHIIITAPSLAFALRFDPESESAPRLIAKGPALIAQRINQLARQHDIPSTRDTTLADQLNQLPLDTQIPEHLYESLASHLRWAELMHRAQGVTPPWADNF